MLADVIAWWLAQWRALLPASDAGSGRAQDALIVAVDRVPVGDAAPVETIRGRIVIRRDGRETALQPLALGGKPPAGLDRKLPVGLRLPADTLLHREVVLPLAAARDLESVIGFEMDRLTPFAADAVFWGLSHVSRDPLRERLNLRLAIVLRAQVQPLLDALARLGLAPGFLEGEGGRIELAAAQAGAGRRVQVAASALCACLAVACLVTPVLRQQIALDRAAQSVARLQPAAREAIRLRRSLAATASGRAAIARARGAGDALDVLAALTQALPDGTWLSDLTLKAGTLTLDGHSTNAAGLIARLAAVKQFSDPAFTAPVTRTVDGKADLFSLQMAVAR